MIALKLALIASMPPAAFPGLLGDEPALAERTLAVRNRIHAEPVERDVKRLETCGRA